MSVGKDSFLLNLSWFTLRLPVTSLLELLRGKGEGANNLAAATRFHFFLHHLPGGQSRGSLNRFESWAEVGTKGG